MDSKVRRIHLLGELDIQLENNHKITAKADSNRTVTSSSSFSRSIKGQRATVMESRTSMNQKTNATLYELYLKEHNELARREQSMASSEV